MSTRNMRYKKHISRVVMELDMTCSVIEELKLEVALAEKEQAKQDANVAKLRVKKME